MSEQQEGYTYPGTHVLRNKPDLRDPAELARFERGATAIRIQELRENPVKGDYDLQHLQSIHRQVFKDVYSWAGEVRTVNIVKGAPGDRTLFALTDEIKGKAERVHADLKEAGYLRGMDKEQFSTKMAQVYAAVNEMHPFREGNGRATREYMYQLGKEAGYQLDYAKVGKEAWNEAAKQSVRGNLAPIREVFYEITTAERAIAFDRLPGREALAKHPELDGAYKALHEARQNNQDVAAVRAEISRELHKGVVVPGNVSVEESKRVIEHAANHQGLMVRDADRLGGTYRGEIVAVSSHHAMLKVGDMVAVRYEKGNLDRDVQVGQRVAIQHGQERSQVHEQGKEPAKERSRDMQMERDTFLPTGSGFLCKRHVLGNVFVND